MGNAPDAGRDDEHGHGTRMTIVFIINGEDVAVQMTPKQKLHVGRDKALQDSGNTGRPADEWEIRTEAGIVLPPDATVESSGLVNGSRVLLSLRVAAGGCECSSTLE